METKEEKLEEVINNITENVILILGDNYIDEDSEIIKRFVTKYLAIASDVSNREVSDKLLIPYVENATIMAYERRGKEASNSNSEGGLSDSFIDIEEKLRKDTLSIRLFVL